MKILEFIERCTAYIVLARKIISRGKSQCADTVATATASAPEGASHQLATAAAADAPPNGPRVKRTPDGSRYQTTLSFPPGCWCLLRALPSSQFRIGSGAGTSRGAQLKLPLGRAQLFRRYTQSVFARNSYLGPSFLEAQKKRNGQKKLPETDRPFSLAERTHSLCDRECPGIPIVACGVSGSAGLRRLGVRLAKLMRSSSCD
ncbi:hypothetical protein MTO96_025617 [Rhipicephalus appendiculatus]